MKRVKETIKNLLAHLIAAISLLERGSKKIAPSDKMFDQMLKNYKTAIERNRATLKGKFNDECN